MKRVAGNIVSSSLLSVAVVVVAVAMGCTSDSSQPAATKPIRRIW